MKSLLCTARPADADTARPTSTMRLQLICCVGDWGRGCLAKRILVAWTCLRLRRDDLLLGTGRVSEHGTQWTLPRGNRARPTLCQKRISFMPMLPERDHRGAPNSVAITRTPARIHGRYIPVAYSGAQRAKARLRCCYWCKQSMLLGSAQRLKHWLMDGEPQRVPVEGA